MRDVFRWCQLLVDKRLPFDNNDNDNNDSEHRTRVRFGAVDFLDVVYLQRLRTNVDRQRVIEVFIVVYNFLIFLIFTQTQQHS